MGNFSLLVLNALDMFMITGKVPCPVRPKGPWQLLSNIGENEAALSDNNLGPLPFL